VERPGGSSGEASIHAAWRMALAHRAAQAYVRNEQLAALVVAGSVGTGLADRFSDLELDCYWFSPPSDRDRTGPIHALGGELEALWAYDHDEEEWSEDYRLGELGVTVSNFLTGTIERFLDDVVLRADTNPVKHMRLAALQRCRPLLGAPMIESWRARAAHYPDKLAAALVEQSLAPEVLSGWAAREALASRGDDLAIHDLLARAERAVLGAVLALNHVYLPHPLIKWQRQLISGLDVSPDRLAERLQLLWTSERASALQEAEALLAETVLLAEARTDASLSPFREALSQRRRAIDPPHS
jgi:hypothetical protein